MALVNSSIRMAVNARPVSRNTICGSSDNVPGAQNSFMANLKEADHGSAC
jgi:hypothetical protein